MKFEIKGEPLPVLLCYLEAGETVTCEKGAMSWMTPNMKMSTKTGGFGKALGKMFSGESIFQNTSDASFGGALGLETGDDIEEILNTLSENTDTDIPKPLIAPLTLPVRFTETIAPAGMPDLVFRV